MLRVNFVLIYVAFAFALISCKGSDEKKSAAQLAVGERSFEEPFLFLSEKEAQQALTLDTMEHFFELINPLDMFIQMKEEKWSEDLSVMKRRYYDYLQRDVVSFSDSEQVVLKPVVERALDLFKSLESNMYLPQISFVKSAGHTYGPDAFYTRNATIVVPSDVADFKKSEAKERLLQTLLHEIAHIYNRYNKSKSLQFYERLGFIRLNSLELSPFLKERVLLNPDGVDIKYAFCVKKSNAQPTYFVPVVFSRFKSFNAEQPAFFTHLMCNFYEVELDENKNGRVVAKDLGYNPEEVKPYLSKSTHNTNYLLHPDEILADNLALLAMYKAGHAEVLKQLAPKGQKLLLDLEQIIAD